MAPRSTAAHVAEIQRTYKGKTYRYFFLRRTYREGGKVKHQTLANLSHLPLPTLELIRRSLRGEHLVAAEEAFEILRTRPHGHVVAALGTLRRLGLDRLLAARSSRRRQLVVAMIVARILEPGSKLATARALRRETLQSTLGELLGVEDADEDELYEAMDWLLGRQRHLEQALAERHLSEGSLALYDVTSTYFEGRSCPLARLGHSRDGRADRPQIVFGLLTDREGCPVAVEVFAGNTADPMTLGSQIAKLRDRFGLRRVVLVGDRGMITSARIEEDFKSSAGLGWITALRAPQIRRLVEQGSLQLSLFDERDLAEIQDPAYPGERLVVCRNPLLAQERARKRRELLEATERELDKIVAATERAQRALRGKDRIGLRLGKVLGRFKMQKHFRISIEETAFSYERDAARIAQEEALDGLYVLRTSVSAEEMSTDEVVRSYKDLAVIERAFRSLKSMQLRVRPIHHRKADRVRAHVLLCMLAYYVEWHMRKALAPLLFHDEDPVAARAGRSSPVAPAHRSSGAEAKARRKRTKEGTPVHSFSTLLHDLATVAKNRLRPKGQPDAADFDLITTPTPLQRQALDLLDVRLTM